MQTPFMYPSGTFLLGKHFRISEPDLSALQSLGTSPLPFPREGCLQVPASLGPRPSPAHTGGGEVPEEVPPRLGSPGVCNLSEVLISEHLM